MTPEQTGKPDTDIKIKVNNPYPFILGEINAHADRVLRDKGAATADVSSAIMTCPQPGFFTSWLESRAALLTRVQELEAVIEKMKVRNLKTIMERTEEDEFNEIIDRIEARAMACDGPVTPTLKEATEEELSRLWQLVQDISPKRKRLQVLARELDNATEDEAVREFLRMEGLDPDQVGREGSVFVKTIQENISTKTKLSELEAENKNQKERIEALIDNHGLTTAKIKTIAAEKTVEELQAKLTAQAAEIETMGQNLNKANDKANAQFKVYELEIENLKKNKAINEALMLEGADKITEQAAEIERLNNDNALLILGNAEFRESLAAKDKELSDLQTSYGFTVLQDHKKEILRLREALEKASSLLAFGKSLIHHLPRQNQDIVEAHPQADLYDVECINLRKEISTLTAALSSPDSKLK